MATVRFDDATRLYPGNDKPSVDRLNIDIEDGEFLVLVGPSGCGKSTSLRMLAGLEEVNGGKIWIGDRDVTHLSPKDRDVAMVFQNYALYPHMTVADNMGFALKIAGVDKGEIRRRVEEAAAILDLGEYLERKPKALSGGQRQRVAMGRAIVRNPQVFLMDEPLSNLDAKLRVQTRTQIASLQRRLGVTTVYVTHDQVEAMTMGDRVAVLKDGILQQCDSPRRMYDHPDNVFVAGFIGSPAMNIMEVPVTDGGVRIGDHVTPVPRDALHEAGRKVIMGVRPEDLELTPDGQGLPVTIDVVEELGADAYVYGTTDGAHGSGQIIARVDGRRPPMKGERVAFKPKADHIHVFDADSGLRLND
ncbi:ABC transporter ATP-binding protein [Arsenicicoccus dermatophilus]|uniref:ABC transporter ATP-binding protein n=1 Tax=Arsenicicoccus dermatophilus TaxID=1076331 RepID=UPI001F4D0C87|nr:sn-glycerol-3-phosphate ABC transporter ATP-binding protein UgpC [Arsenicicoccus dermatophilus]MCH8612000.1 sn-glycerol-3-phosphate ABC transporter ATP-binding protein UgpC [Arsenicicoccus dermatophilus]